MTKLFSSKKNYLITISTIVLAAVLCISIIKAGEIDNTSSPSSTMYTVEDIYQRLVEGEEAVEGGGTFSPTTDPDSTMHTLSDIYSKIPAPDQIKLGTNAGTLAPDGTALATDCLATKTFYSEGSWTQKEGNIANCSIEGGNTCYAASGYWTSTAGGDVTGGEGSITFNIPDGYYSGKTCTAQDSDLTVGNIKKDVEILGAIGTLYGDTDPTKVLTVASAEGTYDATHLTADNIKLGIAFGASGEKGTLTPEGGTAGIADLFKGKTTYITADWDLDISDTGTLERACYSTGSVISDYANSETDRYCVDSSAGGTPKASDAHVKIGDKYWDGDSWNTGTASLAGAANVYYGVSNAWDGLGTLERACYSTGTAELGTEGNFCGDNTGDALETDIKKGMYAWVDGEKITGTLFPFGLPDTGQTQCYDADDPYEITCQGKDGEENNAEGTFKDQDADYVTALSYTADGCGTGTVKDNITGLCWEKDGSTSGKTWQEALNECSNLDLGGHKDWRLPNIKELQSIVNYGNWFPAIGEDTVGGSGTGAPFVNTVSNSYWAGTSYADRPSYAWCVYFGNGYVGSYGKASTYYVRCVRGQ